MTTSSARMGWRCGAALLGLLAGACGGGGSTDAGPDDGGDAPPGDADGDGADDGADGLDGLFHHPYTVVPTSEIPVPRGWQLRRGIIHLHSAYSHDGCDDEGFVDGVRNEECVAQLREALCSTGQDFGFLTDHASNFADHEYPDVLLYAPGDELIERDGRPVAVRIPCGGGGEAIVAAGTETGTMPIGLEYHVGDTPEERRAAYGDVSPAGVEALRAAGAVTLVHHTEDWDVAELLGLPLDGIEIYNLHANLMQEMGAVVNLVLDLQMRPHRVPQVELAAIAFFAESGPDMVAWSRLLEVRRTVGILATDVHRNTFDGTSPDGERLDSYRRLMHAFSNYVLVADGPVDDLVLKDAIREGRLYGAFQYLGYPLGFDFRAEAGATVWEMGDEVPAGVSADLVLALPVPDGLDPAGPQPTIRGIIWRAGADGTWEEVAAGTGAEVRCAAPPGVYRAEVRIVPEHLRPWLGTRPELYLGERPWVYANPIYVDVAYAPPGP